MNRFNFKTSILKIENKSNGEYVLFSDHQKEITKIKLEQCGSVALCNACSKNKICSPHNNYGVIAIECNKFIKRKS